MISPTGKGTRNPDNWGKGNYGSSRKSQGSTRIHSGTDYVCEPGQDVVSPIRGLVTRRARPYAKGIYGGLLIQGRYVAVKMFYFKPEKGIIGCFVKQGRKIGVAQDISDKFPGMTPHIHLKIDSIDPEIFTDFI